MNADQIPLSTLAPAAFNTRFEDVLFLFFEFQGHTIKLINDISGHIEDLDSETRQKIEKTLDLRLRPAARDVYGNVCFADDPDLRPEFRISFHPMDLWDYYYAMWHSSIFWGVCQEGFTRVPLPRPAHFWKMVDLGARLRLIHSSRKRKENDSMTLSRSSNQFIQAVDERFQLNEVDDQKGKLFLNQDLFILNVPKRVWDLDPQGNHTLSAWIHNRIGQPLEEDDIELLLHRIVVIDRTCALMAGIDSVLYQLSYKDFI